MRVAIDLRCLGGEGHSKRGIGKYLYGMLPELFRVGAKHEFELFIWKGTDLGGGLSGYPNVTVHHVASELMATADRFYALRRTRHFPLSFFTRVRADVFMQPDIFYGLYPRLATVAVLYDVIPLLYEREYFTFHLKDGGEFFGWKVRDRYRAGIEQFARTNRILSISQASLDDLHRIAPATRTVPHVITHLAAQKLPRPLGRSLINGRYLLYVGGNDHRKHIKELVGMFESLKADPRNADLKLVLVGNDFKESARSINPFFWKTLDKSSYRADILLKGYVDPQELAGLYKHADLFAFPSQYEGFGLPVIEAMHTGLPVVAFDNSSITEIAHGAACLAKTDKEFIHGMSKLLHSTRLREKLTDAGRARAKQFSWRETARLTLQALVDTTQT